MTTMGAYFPLLKGHAPVMGNATVTFCLSSYPSYPSYFSNSLNLTWPTEAVIEAEVSPAVVEDLQVAFRGVAGVEAVDADKDLEAKVAGEEAAAEEAGLLLSFPGTYLHKFQQGSRGLIFKT